MIEIYCDESRPEVIFSKKNRDRFMVIGGVWIPHGQRHSIKNAIKEIKSKHGINGEFKWNTVSPSKVDFYLELIDYFFTNINITFRCIVVEGDKVDLATYHSSDGELGFYKFYYQLLVHRLNFNKSYWIYVDHKKNKLPDRLHTLKRVLGHTTNKEIHDVQAIDSKQSVLIQLADVLIGAVGYEIHGLKTSKAKMEVVNRIEEHIGHKICSTAKSVLKFNVFKINLGGNE